jgi:hypothetical protein
MMIKTIRTTALILFFMTLLWVVLMVLSTMDLEPGWAEADYVEWISEPSLSFRINYLNVSFLTLGVCFIFVLLFRYLKLKSRSLALAGLIFVPIYGIMNLVCYASQISLVPSMAMSALGNPDSVSEVSRWIQANPDSIAGFVNGLAYAVLAIPSIIYGYLLKLDNRKISGLTFILNGIFCLLGIIGMIFGSKILSMGIMIGGFIFLVSLGCIWFELGRPRDSA